MQWGDLIGPLVVVTVVTFALRRQVRKHQYLREWASRRGYTIVRRLPAWYRVGPFPIAAMGSKQSIHYLLIRDRDGVERRCWLKVGNWFVGHLADDVVVHWEGTPPRGFDPTER